MNFNFLLVNTKSKQKYKKYLKIDDQITIDDNS